MSVASDPAQQWSMFIVMDPPKHAVQRKAVSPGVSAENLKRMEAKIRDSAVEIFDSLPESETFNRVQRVSIELTTTLLTLFDFPLEEKRNLMRWSD